jgi:hypothetical protein
VLSDRFSISTSLVKLSYSLDGKFIRAISTMGQIDHVLIDTNSKKATVFYEFSSKLGRIIEQEFRKNQTVLLPIYPISSDWKKIALEDSNSHSIQIFDLSSNSLLYTLKGHTNRVRAIAFSPNDSIFVSSDEDKNVKLWNLENETLKQNLTGHSGKVVSFEFSSDGKILASRDENVLVKLWDVADGNQISSFRDASVVSFSSDGKFIAIVNNLKEISVFDVKSGTLQSNLKGHNAKITSVLFNLDSNLLISGSEDNTIRIWSIKLGRELASLISLKQGNWLITTPEGFFDGTPNAWKQLIWRFNNNTFDYGAVELYFNDFFYPNLLQDVFAGKSPQAKAGSELEKIDRRQPLVEIVSVNGQTKEQLTAQTVNQNRTARVLVEVADNVSERKRPEQNASSGAQDLRLFRNGSLVKVWHEDVFRLGKADGCEQISAKPNEARRVRCAVEVPIVAGDNNFSAYAFNLQNVKSEDDAVSVKGADVLKRDGTLYVLAVGVNIYENADYNLKYAVPDVVDISAKIKEEQAKLQNNPSLKQYAKTEIITLKDETATKDNILLALKIFAEKSNLPENLCAKLKENLCNELKTELSKIKPVQPEDALLIYYAGHGTSREQRFYLLPHNFTDAKELEKQAVSDIELNQYLEKVDAGKLLMVIDACQSGQALGEKSEGRAPMNSKGLAQLAYDKGMLILTAAQSYQAALEAPVIGDKKVEHGLLTYALLEAFSNREADKDGNRQLWEREWFDFAVSQVPQLQLEMMQRRHKEIQKTKRGAEIVFVNGDNPNADPNDRRRQTPRVFYRREADTKPLLLAQP